jgi:tripartite ATP-independent transporter DctP family solute receptor
MKKWIILLSVLGLAFWVVSPYAVAAEKKPVKIKWASVLSATNPNNVVAVEVAERVKERTHGGVQISLYPASQLGKAPEVFQQQKLGAPIIAETVPSWSADLGFAKLQIMDGPFLYEDVDQLNRFLDSSLVAKWNQEFLEKSGLRILTWNWYGGQRHILSKRGYKTPDELQRVKFRVPETPVWLRTFELLGATPVTIPWAEVYEALSLGVADAVEAPLAALWATKLYEVAKVITLTGHFTAVRGFQISEKLFQSLSPDYQRILIEEVVRGGEKRTQMELESGQEYIEKMTEKGVSFVTPDISLYKAKTKPFFTEEKEKWTQEEYNQVLRALRGE